LWLTILLIMKNIVGRMYKKEPHEKYWV